MQVIQIKANNYRNYYHIRLNHRHGKIFLLRRINIVESVKYFIAF